MPSFTLLKQFSARRRISLQTHKFSFHFTCRQPPRIFGSNPYLSSRFFSSPRTPVLTHTTLNPKLLDAKYAVRGEVLIRSMEIQKEIEAKTRTYPFKEFIACNIGNPHELGQPPITFFRQVVSLCQYPPLLSNPLTSALFPADAIRRARQYLEHFKGTGAYTNSQGIDFIRKQVANFIEERDGYPSYPEDIYLTNGASVGVKMIINAIIRNENDGIMVPIPQYPLYSATLSLNGGRQIGYFLDEDNRWGLQISELEEALRQAREKGVTVRALVVINPGNPTGQCLDAQNMKEIIEFCDKERLVLLADEVYQSNVYYTTPFTSFKKVLRSMGEQYNNFELVSFHSVSKGFVGECGQRGGYMELVGFDSMVKQELYKSASIDLCSNTTGQLMTGLMVCPPKPGDESHELYVHERDFVFNSLKRRAQKLANALNEIPGIKCNPVEGAMYAFPQITFSRSFIEAARLSNKNPDTFYALKLLEHTGIIVVPGSGFGQKQNTYHFRITILPPEADFDRIILQLKEFHKVLDREFPN